MKELYIPKTAESEMMQYEMMIVVAMLIVMAMWLCCYLRNINNIDISAHL